MLRPKNSSVFDRVFNKRTNTGRVVYNRPTHYFNMAAAYRVLKHAVLPGFSGSLNDQLSWIDTNWATIEPIFKIMNSLYGSIGQKLGDHVDPPANLEPDRKKEKKYASKYTDLVLFVEYAMIVAQLCARIMGFLDLTKLSSFFVSILIDLIETAVSGIRAKLPPYSFNGGKVTWL